MMPYIHELNEWPHFRWDVAGIAKRLGDVRHAQGKLSGRMENLGFTLRDEAVLRTLTDDVVKSSEIEGEKLDTDQVRSSIARRLGMDVGGVPAADRDVEGVVEMMLDATQNYGKALTAERLFDWHAALFPTGRSGIRKIIVGAWRDDKEGPMQVVSGPMGRERVHFEGPPAGTLRLAMDAFLAWFNAPPDVDPVVKAGLAHLWFVTIHPFEDGNGRIARAIADMALARSENSPRRFYSMSSQIRIERNAYYDILERTQKGDLDCTEWLTWFLTCLGHAIAGAEKTLAGVLGRHAFWERHKTSGLNERQRILLDRLLQGYEGKLTTRKAAIHTKTSHDTALRDIDDLVKRGILVRNPGGGRSVSYSLVTE
ncbi:MAG: Fic family protein [Tagaea sp.]